MAEEAKKEAPKKIETVAPVSPEDQYMIDRGWKKVEGKWRMDVLDAKTGKVIGYKERN